MVLGRIKSPSISNPCIFQSVSNKEDQRRVKLSFYSDVLNSKCRCHICINWLKEVLASNKNMGLCLYMSHVSPVFHTVVTVSIGLKTQSRVEMSLLVLYTTSHAIVPCLPTNILPVSVISKNRFTF